jgi:hypothetical protein
MLVGGMLGNAIQAQGVQALQGPTGGRLHLCLPLGSMLQDGGSTPNITAVPSIDHAHVWYMRTEQGQHWW